MITREPFVICLDDDDSDDVQIIGFSVCKPESTTHGLDREVGREVGREVARDVSYESGRELSSETCRGLVHEVARELPGCEAGREPSRNTSRELSPPSPTNQAHKTSWAENQNSSDSVMEPFTMVEAKKVTTQDGSGDVAAVQPSGVPKLQITPATAASSPAPPNSVDETLLVPPQPNTGTNCNSVSDVGERSTETTSTPEPPSTNTPADDATSSASTKPPRVRNDRKSPFTAKFFGDMLNTIDRIFPYQTFADEHDCTIGDVHRALMATVFTPLTDANERGKPRIAEKGREMMKKWNQRYKEMVQKLNQESNERQMPMEFEQVLIAASQNLDAYWESRNSGFGAYKAFQTAKKKQGVEDRAAMLKQAAKRDAELTHEAAEGRRKRTKFGSGAAAEGESDSHPTTMTTTNNNNIEHIDLTDPTPTPQPSFSTSEPASRKRHPVLVDAFGHYQDMSEAISDYFDQQYRDMAAGTYVPSNSSTHEFEDGPDEFDEFDDDEDGDYEDDGGKGRKKKKKQGKGRDKIGEMLAILRRSPRRLEGVSTKGKGKGKEVEKPDDDGEGLD